MRCPYCNQEMTAGNLYSVGGRAVYWFPQEKEYNGVVLSKSKIENQGGIVLDETTSVGFIAKNRPDSFGVKTAKYVLRSYKFIFCQKLAGNSEKKQIKYRTAFRPPYITTD